MFEKIKYFFWFLSGGEIRKLNKELLLRRFILCLMDHGYYPRRDGNILEYNEYDDILQDFLETYNPREWRK